MNKTQKSRQAVFLISFLIVFFKLFLCAEQPQAAFTQLGDWSIVAYKDYNEAVKLAPYPSTKGLCTPGTSCTIHEKGLDACKTNRYGYYRCRMFISYTCEKVGNNKTLPRADDKKSTMTQAVSGKNCGGKNDQFINSWVFKSLGKDVFQLNQCTYGADSKSGYLEQINLTNKYVRACWEVSFNSGKTNKGCDNFKPEEHSSASCYSCNPVSSGVRKMHLTCFASSPNPNEELVCKQRKKNTGVKSGDPGENNHSLEQGTLELNKTKMCQKIDKYGHIVATWPPSSDGECSGGPNHGGKSTPEPRRSGKNELQEKATASKPTPNEQVISPNNGNYTWKDGQQIAHQGAVIARVPKCGSDCDQCFQNYPEKAYELLKSGQMNLGNDLIAAEFHRGRTCQDVGFSYCVANTICYPKAKPGATK